MYKVDLRNFHMHEYIYKYIKSSFCYIKLNLAFAFILTFSLYEFNRNSIILRAFAPSITSLGKLILGWLKKWSKDKKGKTIIFKILFQNVFVFLEKWKQALSDTWGNMNFFKVIWESWESNSCISLKCKALKTQAYWVSKFLPW